MELRLSRSQKKSNFMSKFSSSKRLTYLETARGFASIIVVFHHFLLGFFPVLKDSVVQGGLKGTPLYVLVNGNGAVAFFFVLSGFVLTRKFYKKFSVSDLTASILKRLPRLMLPAGLSMMIGAIILIYFPEAYGAAAQLTGSAWLAAFASAGISEDFVPSFLDAAQRSLFVFLWPHHYYQYNSNLWTMVYEFYGSMLVFMLVAACCLKFFRKEYRVVTLHILIAFLCISLGQMLFVPFAIGSLIAFFHCNRPSWFQMPSWSIVMIIVIMIAGYSVDYWPVLLLASTAAMLLLLCTPSLEQWMSGPVGLFLGRLSFPLYLVHVLVIVSVTSAAYTSLSEYGLKHWEVLALCLALTWAVSLLAALPFMALEKAWVPALNRWSQLVIKRFSLLMPAVTRQVER